MSIHYRKYLAHFTVNGRGMNSCMLMQRIASQVLSLKINRNKTLQINHRNRYIFLHRKIFHVIFWSSNHASVCAYVASINITRNWKFSVKIQYTHKLHFLVINLSEDIKQSREVYKWLRISMCKNPIRGALCWAYLNWYACTWISHARHIRLVAMCRFLLLTLTTGPITASAVLSQSRWSAKRKQDCFSDIQAKSCPQKCHSHDSRSLAAGVFPIPVSRPCSQKKGW